MDTPSGRCTIRNIIIHHTSKATPCYFIQQPITLSQMRPLYLSMEHNQLLSQHGILDDSIPTVAPRPENAPITMLAVTGLLHCDRYNFTRLINRFREGRRALSMQQLYICFSLEPQDTRFSNSWHRHLPEIRTDEQSRSSKSCQELNHRISPQVWLDRSI
jgi:hypothetical protein